MFRRRLAGLLRSKTVVRFGVIAVGNSLRLILGAASLIVVAGSMQAEQFGRFATVIALIAPLAAFAGWGGDKLIVRRVSRNPEEFPSAFGTGLVFLAISTPVLLVLAVVGIPVLSGSWATVGFVFLLALSDIVFAALNTMCAACFQARMRPLGTAWLNIVLSAARLAAAGIWLVSGADRTAMSWALFYLVSSALAGSLSVVQVMWFLGRPSSAIAWKDWKDGFHFALQMASFVGFRQIDRPVVGHLAGLSTVGIYVAAFRIADAATMPVQSIMYATFSRFFQLGASGARFSLQFAFRLLPIAAGVGLMSGLAILVVAPFAPRILGSSYAGTETVLMLLSALPALYAIYYLGANVLISSDRIIARTAIQLAMPLVSIGMCYLLVPRYHEVGAAIAALCTHVILATAAWVAAFIIAREPKQSEG